MSFGFSIGDIVLLAQIARQTYRNCKEAGGEYLEIATEVRSLHGVLKSVHKEATRPGSSLARENSTAASNLILISDGCRGVLDNLDRLLAKYSTLQDGVEGSRPRKFWHRIRFGAELEELGKYRAKIVTYTSMLAVFLDSLQLAAVEKVDNRVEVGFNRVLDRMDGFEDMRKAILDIATQARVAQRLGSVSALDSQLSLSTYGGDDKNVWRRFRTEMISLGFRSGSLDRHMDVLQAYMMRLDQSGILDEAAIHSANDQPPWWMNASFRLTNTSLPRPDVVPDLSEKDAENSVTEEPNQQESNGTSNNDREDHEAQRSQHSDVGPKTVVQEQILGDSVKSETEISADSVHSRPPSPQTTSNQLLVKNQAGSDISGHLPPIQVQRARESTSKPEKSSQNSGQTKEQLPGNNAPVQSQQSYTAQWLSAFSDERQIRSHYYRI